MAARLARSAPVPAVAPVRVIDNSGALDVAAAEFIAALRAFVMEQVARLREDHMRPINPTPYKVSVTNELYTRLHAAWLEESPIPEIN